MGTWDRFTVAYLVLSLAGIGVALLLTSFHYSAGAEARLCAVAGGCGTVNTSEYSVVGGVPIAILGLGTYALIALLAWLATRGGPTSAYAPLAIFGVSLIGVLYSVYLTYLELYVIHAICPWCVLSAVLISAIWVVSLFDLRRGRAHAAGAAA